MQELEKILEEIDEATRQEDAPIYCGSMEVDGYVRMSVVRKIIRKHMNDGWIPVEERMPEEGAGDGELIITDKDGRIWSGIYYGITEEIDEEPCFHKWDEEMWHCYKPDVIAWRPLPEPYKPERMDQNEKAHNQD